MVAKKVEVKLIKAGKVIGLHPAVATLILELREGAPRPSQPLTRVQVLGPDVLPVTFFCDRVANGLRLITPAHWWPLVEARQDTRLVVCILEEQSAEQARELALIVWQQHVVPLVASKLSAEQVMSAYLRALRSLFGSAPSPASLAATFGVDERSAQRVIRKIRNEQ